MRCHGACPDLGDTNVFRRIRAMVFSVCLLSPLSLSGQEWTIQNPSLTGCSFWTSFFTDPAQGWAGGSDGLIVHTTDSGKTWKVQNSFRFSTIKSLYFNSRDSGWAAGWADDGYYFLRTNDGGKTWIRLTSLPLPTIKRFRLQKIVFINKRDGWVVGNKYGGEGGDAVFASDDGGATWNSLKFNCSEFYDICFMNDSMGLLTGGHFIGRTSDAGKTWQTDCSITIGQKTTDASSFTGMRTHMVTSRAGYLLGMAGEVLRTNDAGRSWVQKASLWSLGETPPGAIHFTTPDSGFICANDRPTLVLTTTNGGDTWDTFPTDIQTEINDVWYTQPDRGFAFSINGAIYRILGRTPDSFVEITSGTMNDLFAISFSDSLHGYAGGQDSCIIATTDGGKTWEKRWSPWRRIELLIAIDEKTLICRPFLTRLQRSTDGARSWKESGPEGSEATFLMGVCGKGKLTYAISNKNVFFASADSGTTWIKRPISIPAATIGAVRAGCMMNPDTGWIVCHIPPFLCVARTTDGGVTWQRIADSLAGNRLLDCDDVFFVNSSTGWIAGHFQPQPERIMLGVPDTPAMYRTDDGGFHWKEQNSIDVGSSLSIRNCVLQIRSIDGKEAWALREYGLLHTTDGGAHWIDAPLPQYGSSLTGDLYYAGGNNLWIAGRRGFIWKLFASSASQAVRRRPMFDPGGFHGIVESATYVLSPVFFDLLGRRMRGYPSSHPQKEKTRFGSSKLVLIRDRKGNETRIKPFIY